MAGLPFTLFDLLVLAIVGLSGLVGLASGATAAILGLASWIGAAAVALLYGARLSLGLSLLITSLSFSLGVFTGFSAAVLGKMTDMILSRIVDLLLAARRGWMKCRRVRLVSCSRKWMQRHLRVRHCRGTSCAGGPAGRHPQCARARRRHVRRRWRSASRRACACSAIRLVKRPADAPDRA